MGEPRDKILGLERVREGWVGGGGSGASDEEDAVRRREGRLCNLGFRSESFTAARNSDYQDGIAKGIETNNGNDKDVCRPRIKMMVVYESASWR